MRVWLVELEAAGVLLEGAAAAAAAARVELAELAELGAPGSLGPVLRLPNSG